MEVRQLPTKPHTRRQAGSGDSDVHVLKTFIFALPELTLGVRATTGCRKRLTRGKRIVETPRDEDRITCVTCLRHAITEHETWAKHGIAAAELPDVPDEKRALCLEGARGHEAAATRLRAQLRHYESVSSS